MYNVLFMLVIFNKCLIVVNIELIFKLKLFFEWIVFDCNVGIFLDILVI